MPIDCRMSVSTAATEGPARLASRTGALTVVWRWRLRRRLLAAPVPHPWHSIRLPLSALTLGRPEEVDSPGWAADLRLAAEEDKAGYGPLVAAIRNHA